MVPRLRKEPRWGQPRKARNLDQVGDSGDGSTSEPSDETLKTTVETSARTPCAGKDLGEKRHERRTRGIGFKLGKSVPEGGGNPKRGATPGKAKPRP